MRNRYGTEYEYVNLGNDKYTITGDLEYWRFGGKEGEELNMDDLGFVDPSGGPFISIGYEIDGKSVKRISSNQEGIFFHVNTG